MAPEPDQSAPAFCWVPPYDSTDGDQAAAIGAQVGLVPDAGQRRVLDAMYARRGKRLACFEVAHICSRQTGKTAVLQIAALAGVFAFGEPLVVWSSHLFRTSRAAFDSMVALIESNDDFRRRCRAPRTANGQESIELLTGQKIVFLARSKGGGRGLTAAKLIMDEGLFVAPAEVSALTPTLATVTDGQIRWASSAGLPSSEVLRGLRDRGRSGGDQALAYLEWAAPPTACALTDCPHWPPGQVPGCALDNRALWRAACPAYGTRISEQSLANFRASMDAADFAREFLGWWSDPEDLDGRVIDPAAWAAAEGADTGPVGPVAVGVTVAYDRSRTTVGVAARRSDGRVQVELASEAGTGWAVAYLADLARRREPCAVLLDGTAGVFEQALAERSVTAYLTTARDRAQASAALYDALTAGEIRHPGEPVLTQAAISAHRRQLGDGWVWEGASVAPLQAVTLAYRGLLLYGTPKPPPPPLVDRSTSDGWGDAEPSVATVGF